jgi:hypothetical protein
MAKVYYVGDGAIMLGPVFAESPFNDEYKGTEIFNYGKQLVEAIESSGRHTVPSVPAWDFYRLAPGEYERILSDHELFIFSDVETRNFQLHLSFFDRAKLGRALLRFRDRVRLTVEAVRGGWHALFLGGWLSFTGERGKGGWGRTGLAEIVPVACLDHEDLRSIARTRPSRGWTWRAPRRSSAIPSCGLVRGSRSWPSGPARTTRPWWSGRSAGGASRPSRPTPRLTGGATSSPGTVPRGFG